MGVWNKLSTVFITSVTLRIMGSMKVEFHCRILLYYLHLLENFPTSGFNLHLVCLPKIL